MRLTTLLFLTRNQRCDVLLAMKKRGFGVGITKEGSVYNHNFSTVIFDAAGRLQNMWPIGGDMTDQIVAEINKAARAK